MPLLAKDDQKPRERPLLGMHDAICTFVLDVGTHVQKTAFGDKTQHKVIFCWELDETLKTGEYAGRPFMLSKRYTLSLFKKANLAKDLESWLSKTIPDDKRKSGIDLESFIGKKCTLNLIESEDGQYINIANVLPANKDNKCVSVCTEVPEWINKLKAASLEKTSGATMADGTPMPTDADYSQQPPDEEQLPF